MTDHTPSGQQAVDIDTLIQRLDETYVHWIADGCDPSDAISFISNVALCLRALRTAAPTAPSTAAGEPPKHRGEYSTHQQQADACAALARATGEQA